MRRVGVGALVDDVDRIGDLGVRGAVDGLALVPVVHVAVAAHGRVGGPLVARDADEAARPVEFARERVELAPERTRDLEVVALMPHDVEEGLVAAELEILARRVGAEGLVRLAVRVAPEVDERGLLSPRPAAGCCGTAPGRSRRARAPCDRPDRRCADPSTTAAKRPGANRSVAGRPAIGPSASSRSVRSTRLEGLPHLSSALIDSRNGSPARTSVGSTARQCTPGPGTMANLRAVRQRHVVVGGDGIGEHAELELAFAIGLHANAGRALPAVAETDGDGVAGRQEVLHHADVERAAPRADVALELPLRLEGGAVGGLHGGVALALRIGELHRPEVGGEAEADLDRAGVVDAEGAGGVDQRKALQRARLEAPRRGQRRRAHQVGR